MRSREGMTGDSELRPGSTHFTYISKDGRIETVEECVGSFAPDLLEHVLLSRFRRRNIVEAEGVSFLPRVPQSFWEEHLHFAIGPNNHVRLLCDTARSLALRAAVGRTQRADAHKNLEVLEERRDGRGGEAEERGGQFPYLEHADCPRTPFKTFMLVVSPADTPSPLTPLRESSGVLID